MGYCHHCQQRLPPDLVLCQTALGCFALTELLKVANTADCKKEEHDSLCTASLDKACNVDAVGSALCRSILCLVLASRKACLCLWQLWPSTKQQFSAA